MLRVDGLAAMMLVAAVIHCSPPGLVGASATPYPVFPPQVRASLVGHCYGFDAFNCPEMYIGRSFTSFAYFDYAGQRLREDDLFSVNGLSASDGGINFERVYGANLNATHIEITLVYMLSNETATPPHCVKAIYRGQMNNQTFMRDAVLVNGKALVHGNITSAQWLVNAPPAYNNVYFYTGPMAAAAVTSTSGNQVEGAHNDGGAGLSQVYRIEAMDGSFYVDYYDYMATALSNALLDAPTMANCPVVVAT